jgi:hypothetical protein
VSPSGYFWSPPPHAGLSAVGGTCRSRLRAWRLGLGALPFVGNRLVCRGLKRWGIHPIYGASGVAGYAARVAGGHLP